MTDFPSTPLNGHEGRLQKIQEQARNLEVETGPWKIETIPRGGQLSGDNWCIADFGDGDTGNVWVTTDKVHASQTTGAAIEDTAAWMVFCRNHWSLLLAALDSYAGPIPDLPEPSEEPDVTVFAFGGTVYGAGA